MKTQINEIKRMQQLAGILNENEGGDDVYDFVEQNMSKITEDLNIQNISEFDGESEIAVIADDVNYITWTFSFNSSLLKDPESDVEEININNKTLYYIKGEG
jgi:hypothetical protein